MELEVLVVVEEQLVNSHQVLDKALAVTVVLLVLAVMLDKAI